MNTILLVVCSPGHDIKSVFLCGSQISSNVIVIHPIIVKTFD